ncbi:MAG: glycoside hydrolase family 97 protein [Melioribacteraceae bacterium]|nr:glycoside hydrolase family 97 protein [Melioribacteraceae bacterium]
MQNKKLKIFIINVFIFLAGNIICSQSLESYQLKSPNGTIKLFVTIENEINYSLIVDGVEVVSPSQISMTIDDNQVLGRNAEVLDVERNSVQREIKPVVAEKFAVIYEHYNELEINFKQDFSIIFRAYDNGVTYRFKTNMDKKLTVVSEEVTFNFVGTNQIYFPEEESFFSHNERSYKIMEFDTVSAGLLASLPTLVETEAAKLLIAESTVWDYPTMFLKTNGNSKMSGAFPHYPLETKMRRNSDRSEYVTKTADYLAITEGERSFPWRIIAIAREDGDLITNQLVYLLGDELRIEDPSWIKPGKVAWDWWNANNIYGVDFKAGINTDTYKYYIDFASKFGLEYVILDEGWYELGDILKVVPEIDLEEIIAYAKKKNVEIILWVVWKTLDDQFDAVFEQCEKWGVAGLKIDFMQRGDQVLVDYYWRVAEAAAKKKLLVDFHGGYRPDGLRRTYPNVITREGVKGLEQSKWSKDVTPTHNLIIPFIRMVAGPMDYTPGAMVNAQSENFRAIFNRPMSMGTRAHQIAMYVVFESPLQMLADSPSNYLRETESTEFISKIPTTWDDTKVLEASIGEYIILARRNGSTWYIGAMTNENDREFTLDLSFLDNDEYSVEIFKDGLNADRYASDYLKETQTILKGDSITIKLTGGGGWTAILKPKM